MIKSRNWWLVAVIVVVLLPPMARAAEPKPVDRHTEFTDPTIEPPSWPAHLPTPLHVRKAEEWQNEYVISFENWAGGAIQVEKPEGESLTTTIGSVLTPVTAVNPDGFTAAGWAEAGTVCASAVNAIHVKTDHSYASGRSAIFSILPKEMAEVDPRNYNSYLSHDTSLQTDIPAGEGIFGGIWSPLVGSEIWCYPGADEQQALRIEAGWVPDQGDVIVVKVTRCEYNPEYIEFENSFGGLIWIKEIGLDPYPIGQVLKPVVGVGRFLGTLYAGRGRIRAAHPGVICISTTPDGQTGGFQIIPRDHAMSPEMVYTRYKTQWMVVGPLWALDPSWEGLPPLFSDYIYPAFTQVLNDDGTINNSVSALEAFLGRFTIMGRYSDADDPDEYVLLQETSSLDHYALKHLTHLRIYFPRV